MSLSGFAALSFFLACGVLAYTFAGYGLLMAGLARARPRPLFQLGKEAPPLPVCVILVAHNEEHCIAERLQNLLASEYPQEKLRILLVSDGSTDATAARAEALGDRRITIIARSARAGKAAGLNLALAHCQDEIALLADARQRFAPDAVARLAAHFSDPEIGAVSGALEIAPATSATGAGVDVYWRYEKFLRAAESRFDSCIGCTGAIYALRRSLFQPIPEDTLLDDVVIPMQIALQDARVIHDQAARAFDPQPLEPALEQRRKRRTLAGGFQMLCRHPQWLFPWHNRLWWQLVSHKYLRLIAPLFLVSAFLANALLISSPAYLVCFAGQCLFYVCAALGLAGYRSRFFTLPAGFVFLNLMTLRGFRYYFAHTSRTGWE